MKGHTELPVPALDATGLDAAVRECARITAPEITDEEFARLKSEGSKKYLNTEQEIARTIRAYFTAVNTYPAVTELVEALELAVIVLNDGPTRVVARSALSHYRELAGTSNEVAK